MKKHVLFVVLISHFLWAYPQQSATVFEINQRLGRGINMGNAFEAPTESAWGNPWRADYFRIISELGFSHVRIPIRWSTSARTLEQPPYKISPSFLKRIQKVVDVALQNKLHPIINVHHYEELFEEPELHTDRFLAMWEQISQYFSHYPDSLVFEVLNEPHNNLTPERWNILFDQALKIIRVTNPTRAVLLGTAEYGGLSGVSALKIPDDPNIILSVHYYNPFEFTHQGAQWVGDGSRAWVGNTWFGTQEEIDKIKKEFVCTINFAKKHNLPVHVGEFGAYSSADLDSRVRWTNFLARWFEEQGFSWAYWEFSAGFGIYHPQSGELIKPLVDALLHNPMPKPATFDYSLLYRHNFAQGMGEWSFIVNQGAQASAELNQNLLEVNITDAGTHSWQIQLMKQDIPMEKGQLYKVSFTAQAVQNPRQMAVYTGKKSRPYNAYGRIRTIALSDRYEEHSFIFVSNEDDPVARLVFDLGLSHTGIKLGKVKIEKLTVVNKK